MELLPVEKKPVISALLIDVTKDICNDKKSKYSSLMPFGKYLLNNFKEDHPIWNWVELFTPEWKDDFVREDG